VITAVAEEAAIFEQYHMQSLKEPLLKPCMLAGCRTSMSGSGGCIAGIWLRIG